jgi:hypothetical protein
VSEELLEPLSYQDAKVLMRRILTEGDVRWSDHALKQMAEDEFGPVSKVDVTNVIRGGVVDRANFDKKTWRYRVGTARISVVVAFRGTSALAVVTVWRNKP